MYCPTCGTQRPDEAAIFCPTCGAPYRGLGAGAIQAAGYAGWWSRVGASLLDGLVLLLVAIPAIVLLAKVGSNGGLRLDTAGGGQGHLHISRGMWEAFVAAGAYWLAAQLIYTGLTMRRPGAHNGQTLGKQALNIRVARDSGAEVGFGYAVVREVAVKGLLLSAISNIPVGGVFAELIWYLWPLWDSTNRAPHDMIVKSHVVRVGGWSAVPLSVPA